MKHKEDLITPPWASKPAPTAEEKTDTTTIHLRRRGIAYTRNVPTKRVEYWRKHLSGSFEVLPEEATTNTCSGHECFKKKTGVCCSRCKK